MVHFLPPYLPDLNPVEEVFSKIKYFFSRMMRSLKVQLRKISFYRDFVLSQQMIAMVTLSMQDTHDAAMIGIYKEILVNENACIYTVLPI